MMTMKEAIEETMEMKMTMKMTGIPKVFPLKEVEMEVEMEVKAQMRLLKCMQTIMHRWLHHIMGTGRCAKMRKVVPKTMIYVSYR
jgi:hypothetical protein